VNVGLLLLLLLPSAVVVAGGEIHRAPLLAVSCSGQEPWTLLLLLSLLLGPEGSPVYGHLCSCLCVCVCVCVCLCVCLSAR